VGTAPRTSQCLLCGRIWFGSLVEKCERCGGLCWSWDDSQTHLLHRRGDRYDSNALHTRADVGKGG
jgi:hypothetical protein